MTSHRSEAEVVSDNLAICAACGAVQRHRLILCEECKQPLVFLSDPPAPKLVPLDRIIREDLLGQTFAIDRKLFPFLSRCLTAKGFACRVTLPKHGGPYVLIEVMEIDLSRPAEQSPTPTPLPPSGR
jgi:hypothetical protein